MKTLRIREIDHTIQPPIAWEKFEAPNEFVASLVAAAVRDGTTTMDDSEGCPVTATVWEECAEAANRPALVYAVNCNASIDGVVRRKTGMGKTKFFTEQVTGGSRGEAVACQSGREAVSPSGPVVVNQLILEAGKR